MKVPIVIIGRFRYANAKVMGVGHDWAEGNADLTWVAGLTKVDTFHIAPDLGMAVSFFKRPSRPKPRFPNCASSFRDIARCLTVKSPGNWAAITCP